MVLRCPACNSSVLAERELDVDALVCLGCGRRWERPIPCELAFRAPVAAPRGPMQDPPARTARSGP